MHHLEKQLAFLSQINEYLFLGGEDALASKGFKRQGITHVVSIIQNCVIVPDHIKHIHIAIADSSKENIRRYFDQVLSFIDEAITQDGKVLVHCEKGMSRSASFVIAWLMHDQHRQALKVNYSETLQWLKRIRSVVSPNEGFTLQLIDYATELNQNLMRPTSLSSRNPILDQKDCLLSIVSYLAPEEWSALNGVSRFFRQFVNKEMSTLWLSRLKELKLENADADIQFWQKHGLSFPAIFSLYHRLNKLPLPKISLAFAVGFSAKESACQHYEEFFKSENNQDMLKDMVTGTLFGFKLEIFKRCLKWCDPKQINQYLSYAVAADNVEALEYLGQNYKLDWNIRTPQGGNLLFIAAYYGSYKAFLYLHTRKGLDPTTRNTAGANLLESLCYTKNRELMLYIKNLNLLDPYSPNHSNITPLNVAEKLKNTIFMSAFEGWPVPQAKKTAGATGF